MPSVSQAYVMGICEGRATLRRFQQDRIPVDLETARRALANSKECLTMGFAGDMRDHIRGERDFWKNQLKRLVASRAIHGEG